MSFIPSEKEMLLKKKHDNEDDDEDQPKNSKKNFLRLDGTNCPSANMDWCNFKLQNLAPGTAATDAVNKSQLDAGIIAASIEADPLAIRKDGSSLVSADIPFGSHKLKGVAAGTLADDAVNKGQMDAADALKASVSYVDAADAVQDVAIALKASTSYVDSQNASQDTAIALKASQSYVDAQNSTQDSAIALKASISYVDSQNSSQDSAIALKAATSYVDSQNASQDSAIALKAASSYVDSQDALKVSKSGDSMSGTLNMSNNPISGLSNVNFQADGVGNIGTTGRPFYVHCKESIYTGGDATTIATSVNPSGWISSGSFTGLSFSGGTSLRGGGGTGFVQGVNQGELNDIASYVYEVSPFHYSQHFVFTRLGTLKMGDLNFGVPAEPHIIWGVDGTGDIGKSTGNRPRNMFATGNLRLGGSLGVGNSAAASTPGTVVKKMEVFDAAGASLGFVAIYNSIS